MACPSRETRETSGRGTAVWGRYYGSILRPFFRRERSGRSSFSIPLRPAARVRSRSFWVCYVRLEHTRDVYTLPWPRSADAFAYGKVMEKKRERGWERESNEILELMRTVRARSVVILDRPCDFLKNKTREAAVLKKQFSPLTINRAFYSARSKWNHYFKWI